MIKKMYKCTGACTGEWAGGKDEKRTQLVPNFRSPDETPKLHLADPKRTLVDDLDIIVHHFVLPVSEQYTRELRNISESVSGCVIGWYQSTMNANREKMGAPNGRRQSAAGSEAAKYTTSREEERRGKGTKEWRTVNA
jgi:hypothetical protein